MIRKMRFLVNILVALLILSSCNYDRFDDVQVENPVKMNPNLTIKGLKDRYIKGGNKIYDELVIGGTVISDDSEGSFYKTLVIQDETGGIEVKLARPGLYNFFKPGQIVYVKCLGLQLGAYGDNVSIGAVPKNPKYENDFIVDQMIDSIVVKGETMHLISPKKVTIKDFDRSMNNTLIMLSDVQFIKSDLSKTWADINNKKNAINRTLEDRSGNRVIVRTSGYTRFAGDQLPQGSGEVFAILSYFRNTPQLIVMKKEDVEMNNPRF